MRSAAERAAHLVDHVFPPDVPVRQWVLSVPHRLRYRLAYDHRLCRRVLGVFVRALRSAYRRRARRCGIAGGETGMVTAIQRFGGALNLHVRFHTLVLDGVFVRAAADSLAFVPAAPPTDEDVARVVQRVRRWLEAPGVGAVAPNPLVRPRRALPGGPGGLLVGICPTEKLKFV
jgi:Putative transposase